MARPLPDPVLFLDECLGTADVAAALRAKGARTECLVDHFASGTHDEEWLPVVGQRHWVVLTKDKWIRRRELERQALFGAKVAVFVLNAGDLKGSEMAVAFAQAHPRILKLYRDYEPPFVATLDARGTVKIVTDALRRGGRKKGP